MTPSDGHTRRLRLLAAGLLASLVLVVAGAAPAQAGATQDLLDAVAPKSVTDVVRPVTDAAAPITDPVVGAAEPATDPVVQTVQPVVEPVKPVVDEVVEHSQAEQIAEPATQTVAELARPVAEAAAPVAETAAEAVKPVAEVAAPVTRSVERAAKPVTQAAADAVVEPVARAVQHVADATAPVRDAVEPIAEAVNPSAGSERDDGDDPRGTRTELDRPAGPTTPATATEPQAAGDGRDALREIDLRPTVPANGSTDPGAERRSGRTDTPAPVQDDLDLSSSPIASVGAAGSADRADSDTRADDDRSGSPVPSGAAVDLPTAPAAGGATAAAGGAGTAATSTIGLLPATGLPARSRLQSFLSTPVAEPASVIVVRGLKRPG